MPSDTQRKKKIIIGVSVAVASVIIVGFVASKVIAKPTSTTPTGGSNTPPATGLTTPPHVLSCGKTSYTVGNTIVTGVLCTMSDTTTNKVSGGLRCHSDQNMYGVPALKCVKFTNS